MKIGCFYLANYILGISFQQALGMSLYDSGINNSQLLLVLIIHSNTYPHSDQPPAERLSYPPGHTDFVHRLI